MRYALCIDSDFSPCGYIIRCVFNTYEEVEVELSKYLGTDIYGLMFISTIV